MARTWSRADSSSSISRREGPDYPDTSDERPRKFSRFLPVSRDNSFLSDMDVVSDEEDNALSTSPSINNGSSKKLLSFVSPASSFLMSSTKAAKKSPPSEKDARTMKKKGYVKKDPADTRVLSATAIRKESSKDFSSDREKDLVEKKPKRDASRSKEVRSHTKLASREEVLRNFDLISEGQLASPKAASPIAKKKKRRKKDELQPQLTFGEEISLKFSSSEDKLCSYTFTSSHTMEKSEDPVKAANLPGLAEKSHSKVASEEEIVKNLALIADVPLPPPPAVVVRKISVSLPSAVAALTASAPLVLDETGPLIDLPVIKLIGASAVRSPGKPTKNKSPEMVVSSGTPRFQSHQTNVVGIAPVQTSSSANPVGAKDEEGFRLRRATDIPLAEYEKLRKDFADKLVEVFRSKKPHSKSRILMLAEAGTNKAYLYKSTEKAIARQMDRALEGNYEGIMACFYLIDAVISRARKEYGKNKEKFSARLLPLLKTNLTRLMNLKVPSTSPLKSTDGGDDKTVHLLRAKGEIQKLLRCWVDKKVFRDTLVLSTILSRMSVLSSKSDNGKSRSKPTKPVKKLSKKSLSGTAEAVGSPPSPTISASSAEAAIKAPAPPAQPPKHPPVPAPAIPRLALPIGIPMVFPPPNVASSGLQLVNSSLGMDLETRVKALAEAGHLSMSGTSGILPVPPAPRPLMVAPPASLFSRLAAAPAFAPPLPPMSVTTQPAPYLSAPPAFPPQLPTAPQQLPLYTPFAANPARFLATQVLPVGLLAAASARLPQPPPSVIPGDDQLAAFYRDVEEIKQRPDDPPESRNNPMRPEQSSINKVMQDNDPLLFDHLTFWCGYAPKPRPQHFSVVTSMLALRFLPKNGKDVEENKRVISSLFAHSGPVVKVLLESGDNFAVVVMERRFHAHHAKRRILEGERGSPVDYSADENVLVTLIRSRRVLLQWHPIELIRKHHVKCWESTHGCAFVPHDTCSSSTSGRQGFSRNFDVIKFRQFARDILCDRQAVILPESLPPSSAKVYKEIVDELFPASAVHRKYLR